MERKTWTHQSGSSLRSAGYTGFSGVARRLSELGGGEVSRQLVYAWWTRRRTTGFPEKHPVSTRALGRQLELFKLTEVEAWYRENPRFHAMTVEVEPPLAA